MTLSNQLIKPSEVDPHQEQSNIHYDWITAVLPLSLEEYYQSMYDSIPAYISGILLDLGFLPEVQPKPLKHGVYTYDSSAQLFDGTVILGYPDELDQKPLFTSKIKEDIDDIDKDSKDTLMIQISGRGLDSMNQMLATQGYDINLFIDKVYEHNGWFSRIDAALDLYNFPDEYSPLNAYEQAFDGLLVSKSRRVRWMHEFASSGAIEDASRYSTAEEGTTLYIGRNPNQLRIYNKKAERDSKVGKRFNIESWYRWEFQLNGHHAMDFMHDVRSYGLEDAYRARLKMHRFIKADDSNRSRCSNQAWYDRLVNDLTYTITSVSVKPSFERTVTWFKRQVRGPLAMLYETHVNKYIQNGLSASDAELMALKQLKSDFIDTAIFDNKVDWDRITDYLVEHTDGYGRNPYFEDNLKDSDDNDSDSDDDSGNVKG